MNLFTSIVLLFSLAVSIVTTRDIIIDIIDKTDDNITIIIEVLISSFLWALFYFLLNL